MWWTFEVREHGGPHQLQLGKSMHLSGASVPNLEFVSLAYMITATACGI